MKEKGEEDDKLEGTKEKSAKTLGDVDELADFGLTFLDHFKDLRFREGSVLVFVVVVERAHRGRPELLVLKVIVLVVCVVFKLIVWKLIVVKVLFVSIKLEKVLIIHCVLTHLCLFFCLVVFPCLVCLVLVFVFWSCPCVCLLVQRKVET